ncbi:hypothetical protein Cylst_5207 [Cylindrospermum stagnale PCC 7417]|uniref:Uncharacterized protein n=1 Tax=Cylindrospermum stagnale PCC 7417 TaxID=56107 RepID=K9X6H7_9NOST|nr:hypothetical protein [Cylindrospermum stagnale]AFZ27242.1 hypothetical protein Cylst_5207 [Cylindrospermum stagnale PCC 7417]
MTEQHYRITLDEAIAHYQAGWITTTELLGFYFKIFPNFPVKSQKEICQELGIKKSAFYAAIIKLDSAGLLPDSYKRDIYENSERQVVKQLQLKLGGETEVVTTIGRIDLLTDTEIIEVKQISDWKAALGQVLTYSAFFPEHTKRIHLFGDCTPEKQEVICSTVSSFGVVATFEEVES